MPDEPELSFEQALTQIERIVVNLERGEPDLTTALTNYEKGIRMLTLCYRLLDEAEQSAALLTGVDEQGNPITAPFDAAATIERERAQADPLPRDIVAQFEAEDSGASVRPGTTCQVLAIEPKRPSRRSERTVSVDRKHGPAVEQIPRVAGKNDFRGNRSVCRIAERIPLQLSIGVRMIVFDSPRRSLRRMSGIFLRFQRDSIG